MKGPAVVIVVVIVAVIALAVGWYVGHGRATGWGHMPGYGRNMPGGGMMGPGAMGPGMMDRGRWSGHRMYEMMNAMHRDYSKPSYRSNGERIFLTGTDTSGVRLEATNMPGMGQAGMMQMGCANCHGAAGKGGTFTFPDDTIAPDVTWPTLSKPMKMNGETEPAYTEKTLRRAITEGIGSDGDELAPWMPRWQMPERDLDDLVAYLKKL